MNRSASRRAVLHGGIAAALATRIPSARAQSDSPAFSLPIGLPGQILGDGFFVRHGYACENTWYNPGWLHTGEDWYPPDGDAAGAGVYAVADGEVVFAGSEYPGRVVVVQHAADLYSMYGHLDDDLAVATGEAVARGQLLGTVLPRTDGRAPSHLHFEVRTFLTTPEVNGDAPRYAFACGFDCPPGPGYWPIDAPEHPSDMGWRNPTHVLAAAPSPAPRPGCRSHRRDRRRRHRGTLVAPFGSLRRRAARRPSLNRRRPLPVAVDFDRPRNLARHQRRGLPPLVPHRPPRRRIGMGSGGDLNGERHRIGRTPLLHPVRLPAVRRGSGMTHHRSWPTY